MLDQDNEAPGKPAAPTVAALNAVSLQVDWMPPATNHGPRLIDYDVRYRRQAETSWRAHPHFGIGTDTIITGLETDADYVIEVRANSEEGASHWSDAGQGRPVNFAPTSADFSKSTTESTAATFAEDDFPFRDVDPHDDLKAVRIVSLPSGDSGTLLLGLPPTPVTANQTVLNQRLSSLQFVPEAGFAGLAMFQFQVADRTGLESISHTATIAVGEVNDPPMSAPFLKHAVEDTAQSFTLADFTFRDPDPLDALASVKVVTLPDATHGVLNAKVGSDSAPSGVQAGDTIFADKLGTLKFTPVANWYGSAVFRFRVADLAGSESAAHRAIVEVAGVNDAPVSAAFRKTTGRGQAPVVRHRRLSV